MGVYLYPNNTETPLKEAYIGIPFPTSIVLNKSSINLTTVGQTEQLTATIEPTVSDKTITWATSDTTAATVSTTGLVTCVTPGTCTITATTVNGLTASCSVVNNQGWQPGVNTLLYCPLNSIDTYTDQSGNNRSTTNTSVTFGTYQGVDCGYFNGSSAHIQVTPFSLSGTLTFCVWVYNIFSGGDDGKMLDARQGGNLYINYYGSNEGYAIWDGPTSYNYTKNQWMLFVSTVQNGDRKLYLKGNGLDQVYTGTASFSSFTPTNMNIGNEHNNGASRFFAGGMSELILEDKIWTAQEIADYYDQTKSLYGIS